ncbi:MAG: class IV adenylate cyclase [Acidobacteria bacterium]|nr:class IV adenylate cyclase [Acidobacteriota bacterium]
MSIGVLHREIEVKVPVSDLAQMIGMLRARGYVEHRPRHFEQNTIYDLPDGSLRARGELIRLRRAGDESIFTFKGRASVAKHKEREEIESGVTDPVKFALILNRLGFSPTFRYEKFRTEWARPGQAGIVMIDETPIGNFVELEGDSNWIDSEAAALGFAESDYTNLSYARLYEQYCRAKQIEPGHMVFENHQRDARQFSSECV